LGGVFAERAARGEKGHGNEAKGRSKLADAIENLLAIVTFVFGIGAILAKAAVPRARILAAELGGFVRDRRTGAGKGEAVNRRIGVTDEPQRVVQRGLTSLVNRFAKQQDGAAVVWRLRPQLFDGKSDGIQDCRAVVAFGESRERASGVFGVGRKWNDQVRRRVEADQGGMVVDVADQRIERGVESLIIRE